MLAALAGRRRLTEQRTLAAIRTASVGIAVLTVALTVQAFARQPVTSASSLLVGAAAAAGAWVAYRSDDGRADEQPVEADMAVAR